MEKQDAFTQALLRAMDAAEQEVGVRQPRLRRAVEQYGGISAVRELCRRGQVSDGFDQLAGLGKLALSAEALAVSAKFNACFTDDEVNHCFAQLCAANYFGKARF